jgi:hypothetical protein
LGLSIFSAVRNPSFGEGIFYSRFGTSTSPFCSLLRKWNKQVLRGRAAMLRRGRLSLVFIAEPDAHGRHPRALVHARRIITTSTAPATTFASDGHFSTNTFRIKNGPRGRFSSGPFSSTKCGRAIGVRAAVPLPLPLHAREFHGRAQHGRASALPERTAFVGFPMLRLKSWMRSV